MISTDDVKKLASLARIKVEEKDIEKLAKDMAGILDYVNQIQEVSSSDGSDTNRKDINRNVLREDTHPHESGIHTKAILDNAPAREGDYIKVKKIL